MRPDAALFQRACAAPLSRRPLSAHFNRSHARLNSAQVTCTRFGVHPPSCAQSVDAEPKDSQKHHFAKFARCCQILKGSFPAVLKQVVANEYAFCNIFQNYKICTLSHRAKLNIFGKQFEKSKMLVNFQQNCAQALQKSINFANFQSFS